ncbi:hypothetical protein EAI_01831 [Harpegnathos saltator]|uniref:Uncharacterized protein n=1 Tax=Harpegnathos saltator TaxID=610380 RepID=E2B7C6_HARSA|nr:hypothetical protein EAI_01831 [Harpegnathos saltator]
MFRQDTSVGGDADSTGSLELSRLPVEGYRSTGGGGPEEGGALRASNGERRDRVTLVTEEIRTEAKRRRPGRKTKRTATETEKCELLERSSKRKAEDEKEKDPSEQSMTKKKKKKKKKKKEKERPRHGRSRREKNAGETEENERGEEDTEEEKDGEERRGGQTREGGPQKRKTGFGGG